MFTQVRLARYKGTMYLSHSITPEGVAWTGAASMAAAHFTRGFCSLS